MAEDPKPPPETNAVQDSWAWRPESLELGKAFFEKHDVDADRSPPADLLRLADWLFTRTNGELKNLVDLQAEVREHFDPTDKATSDRLNGFLAHKDRMGNGAPKLGHAQWVMLWHVLFRQEDVRLIAPMDVVDDQAW